MTGSKPRVAVLGGYGFIGSAVARALEAAGADVTVLGRSPSSAARVLPGRAFRKCDLARMSAPQDWGGYLQDADFAVNCAGLLQDGPRAELEQVHHRAIAALASACAAGGIGLLQISAAGARPDASTDFMRTKAAGDAAVRKAGGRHWILRPGLVIGQAAFGGTLLLRMLAAVPLVQPVALGRAPVQCAGLADVAEAVVQAVTGRLPPGSYDLVEDDTRELGQVLASLRCWLGFAPAWLTLPLPLWLLRPAVWGADRLGRLGWRVPMRSTAIRVLLDGITGDPGKYRTAARRLPPLEDVLQSLPAGRASRLEARMALLMPFCVAVLCLFWLTSGLVGLWQLPAAAAVLAETGWSRGAANASVLFWSAVDILLGSLILVRRWAGRACLGMAAVSVIYLGAASLFTPALWADPLGPLVKVLPGLVLTLVTRQLLEER